MSKNRIGFLLGVLAVILVCTCLAAMGGSLVTWLVFKGQAQNDKPMTIEGLVAYYPLNGNANDESGNENHGTEYGGIEYVESAVGKAARFDGSDDFMDVPNRFFTEVTASALIRYDRDYVPTNDKGYKTVSVVDGWRDRENFILGIKEEDGQVLFTAGFHDYAERHRCYHEIHVNSDTIVQSGVFYHVAMTYDGTTLRLYVNGVVEGQTSTNKDSSYSCPYESEMPDIRLGVGRRDAGWFYGLVDEVLVYNRSLSPSDILALYEQTRQRQ